MSELAAIAGVSGIDTTGPIANVTVTQIASYQVASATTTSGTGFTEMMTDAVAKLDSKVAEADNMVAQFAVDPNTPIHHVTIALEEARMAVELATQVRQRLTEGYRELMNMQL